MMEQDSQSNPLLDAWMDGQKKFFQAQKEWLDSTSEFTEKMETPQTVLQAEEYWESCTEQYRTWMNAMENWFPSIADFNNKETNITVETIKRMMDPSNFLNSGLDEINQAFYKLVDAPELADIGTFERKFLKSSKDWAEMRKASADYMKITSDAWTKSFTEYTKELNNKSFDENDTAKDFLDKWLNIANKNLVKIQRSDEFLKAQRDLINASTQYKIKTIKKKLRNRPKQAKVKNSNGKQRICLFSFFGYVKSRFSISQRR